MLNIILRKLPIHYGEVSVIFISHVFSINPFDNTHNSLLNYRHLGETSESLNIAKIKGKQ